MAERVQVLERVESRLRVIQHDIAHAFGVMMARYGNDGHGGTAAPGRVDQDDAVDRSFEQQLRVLVNQVGAMAMTGNEVEIALLKKTVLDATHHERGIPF